MDNQPISFEDVEDALRQSWEIHRQAFGPILEPAFVENQQVRIPLINALNYISRREIKKGLDILKEICQYCIYDEDKAAWTFFVGLSFEMSGSKKQMLKWYADAGKYHHRFYLPYLKLAKAAHTDGQLEDARHYYETAIDCLLEMSETDRDAVILGSAYANLTSCLTMLRRYQEAEAVWQKARQYPLQPDAAATAAILYATLGDTEKSTEYLYETQEKAPDLALHTREMIRRILDGTHPDFHRE